MAGLDGRVTRGDFLKTPWPPVSRIGPDIRVQVQSEAQRKKNFGSVLVVRDSRIADCAKKNRIEILAQHVEGTRGQRDSFTQVLFGTPIELGEFQSGTENIIDTAQNV